MRSELFRLLDVSFPAYFVLLLTGFIFAAVVGVLWARRIGLDPDVIVDLSLAMLLAGVVGARVFHVLFDGYFWDYVHLCTDPKLVDWQITKAQCLSPRYMGVWDAAKNACHPTETDCLAWAKFWAGGLTYYGGLLFASVTGYFILKRDRFPFWKAADIAGLGIPLGLGFGRMGCFLAGCCFGRPTHSAWGLEFPPHSPASESQFKLGLLPSPAAPSLPVHATQLYESLLSFGIAAVCMLVVARRKRYDGQVLVAFLALYATGRFALEFLRADDRGGAWGLSTSQLIGLVIVPLALAIHVYRAKRVKPLRMPSIDTD